MQTMRLRADDQERFWATEEDRRRLAEIEARNQWDARVYQVEKLLGESREKPTESDIIAVEEALEQCKRALADGGVDRIRSAAEALDRATNKVVEALRHSGAVADAAASRIGKDVGHGSGGGEVIEAELVDKSKKPDCSATVHLFHYLFTSQT